MILLNESVAVACQFIQHTDPRFPLVYFTVNSAVLAAITASIALGRPRSRWLPAMRIASAVGVLLSAVIFAAVIAPATPTGSWFQPWDDVWVRTATVLMHGTAPVLVVADLALSTPWRRVSAWMAAGLSWPLTYLAGASLLTITGWFTLPYPFLLPSQMGWGTVAVAIGGQAALVVAITVTLFVLNQVTARIHGGVTAPRH